MRQVIAGVLAGLLSAVPCHAVSVMALDFVVRVGDINAFLAESSRLAETNGARRGILSLARREVADRPPIAAAVRDWGVEAQRAAREADFGPSLDKLGQIFGPSDRSVTIVVREGRPVLPDLAVRRGADFDALYVASQTDALERLVGFYVDFIKNGDDETLRRLAIRDLPRARQLLAEIRRK